MKWYEAVLIGGAIVGIYALLKANDDWRVWDDRLPAQFFLRVEGGVKEPVMPPGGIDGKGQGKGSEAVAT